MDGQPAGRRRYRGAMTSTPHCGHLIGNFPRDWILEIHFVDRPRQIGGFFEQLLTVD